MNPFQELDRFSGTAIVLGDGSTRSYRELIAAADRSVRGLNSTDLVAIECDNSEASLAAYLGALRLGIPPLLVGSQLASELRSDLYSQYGISAVFQPSNGGWVRLLPTGPEVHPDLALLLSTSGSTGSPKLVRLSRQNIVANARQIVSYLGIDESSRAMLLLPQQYAFGLSILHSHWIAGGSLVLPQHTIMERGFWETVASTRPDSLSGVPTTFDQLSRLRIRSMELPSLKTLTQAGGKLNIARAREFAELAQERGWRFWMMYGQTEGTARMSYLPPEMAIQKPESIGIPVDGGRFEILDGKGEVIASPHTPGSLVYYGPNVMMGYAFSADDLKLGDTQQGRLETGDIAAFDADGFYSIRGRTSRFVKVDGARVQLDELEEYLRGAGFDVVLCGREELIAIVGKDRGANESARGELVKRFGIPGRVVRGVEVEEIPRSESGKVRYGELVSRLGGTTEYTEGTEKRKGGRGC